MLPVQHALQGHPESGRLWEEHANKILSDPHLNFKSTTHDKCAHHTVSEGHTVLLLWQVDDFLILCKLEHISKKLMGHNKTTPPFKHPGPANDCDGIDLTQTEQCVKISCLGHIDRVTRVHG